MPLRRILRRAARVSTMFSFALLMAWGPTAVAADGQLRVSAEHRTRYEHLANQFRAGVPGDASALFLRTLLKGELQLDPVFALVELADSRMHLASADTPANTTLVDPIDILQAHGGVTVANLFAHGDRGSVRAGRMTLHMGSRRFVARHVYRNTIGAFTGLDATWSSAAGDTVRSFVTLPVRRRPTAPDDLLDNEIEFDRESFDEIFWGVFTQSHKMTWALRGEAFVFGLHEKDSSDVATTNRQLLTPGLRVFRTAAPGQFDLEVESAVQTGSSRATKAPDDTRDLDHLATFAHGEVGYTFDVAMTPRLAAQFDHASGDDDPADGRNGRYDSLFGPRRYELGPTGLYGAFGRANMNSPRGLFTLKPRAGVSTMAAYRAVWLASARDAWSTGGARDPTGASGSFVGQELEVRVRWHAVPDHVTLEGGFAHLWLGGFATSAPNANGNGDPTYGYGQVVFNL